MHRMREDRYLNISDVTKSYPNPFGDEIAVVKGFDLTVTKGEVISIIGHSGCGKSTVLNMVAGLIPVSLGGIILESCEVIDPGPDRAVLSPAWRAMGSVPKPEILRRSRSRREQWPICSFARPRGRRCPW